MSTSSPPASPQAAASPEDAPAPGLWTLATTFNAIAMASFGGGLSAWSREVVVHRRGWLSEEAFLSAMTICRVLPGANQVNVAVFVGTRLRGWPGALAALAGLLAVPLVVVLLMAAAYARFGADPDVRHVLAGLSSGAIGLTFAMAWHTGRQTLRALVPAALFAASFAMSAILRTPLLLTLCVLGPLGFAWAWRSAPSGKPE